MAGGSHLTVEFKFSGFSPEAEAAFASVARLAAEIIAERMADLGMLLAHPSGRGESPLAAARGPRPAPEPAPAPPCTRAAPVEAERDDAQTDLEDYIEKTGAPELLRGMPTAPAEPPPGAKHGDGTMSGSVMFNRVRNAVIRRYWPAGIATEDIYRLINSLPGKPLREPSYVGLQAKNLGVKRPVGYQWPSAARLDFRGDSFEHMQRQAYIDAGVDQLGASPVAKSPDSTQPPAPPAQAVESRAKPRIVPAYQPPPPQPAAPVAQAPKSAPSAPVPFRTDEREERLRRSMAAGDGIDLIVQILNAFPGGKFTTAEARAWIEELKLEPPKPPPGDAPLLEGVRLRVFMQAYQHGEPFEQMLVKLNALAGPHLRLADLAAFEKAKKLTRVVERPGAEGRAGPKEPKDWNSVIAWARRNNVRGLPRNATNAVLEQAVNIVRQKAGLRLWSVVDPRGPKCEIPTELMGNAA